MPTRTVCIVGAGPSGLVAAKSLLHNVPSGTFHVTIFDPRPRVGGMWPSRRDDTNTAGSLNPLMLTNQSKYSMHFSDLAWEDADPQFPRAWQVGRYLHRYWSTYCQNAKLVLGARVQRAEPVSLQGTTAWKVTTTTDGETQEHTFDYLLVASGYFGKPSIPPEVRDVKIPAVHSSAYRSLPSLIGSDNGHGGKILVIGGQMSGVEIAATVAAHISSARYSPGPSPVQSPEKYTVHHVTHQRPWVLPLYTIPNPSTTAAPIFLPLDLGAYNLAKRAQPLTNTQGHISQDAAKSFHDAYMSALGSDQSAFSPDVAITGHDTNEPPYITVSDNYLEFVRSGLISISHGKLSSFVGDVATITPSNEAVDDVVAIISAVGFEAADSISFLPDEVQKTLSACPEDRNITLALAFHGTHHPALPTLGFVGFYRAPHWGVMEMQARFIATLWDSGGPSSPSLPGSIRDALAGDMSVKESISLRTDPRASQFPMGDYPWLMHEFASALELSCRPLSHPSLLWPSGMPMDFLTPARFPSKSLSEAQEFEVNKSLENTEATTRAATSDARYVARAVFRSLAGEWKLEREIISQLPSHPSGHFSGTAKFLLRDTTRDGWEAVFDKLDATGATGGEYLYVEEGDFKATNGLTFRATRRYVWRYNELLDKLSVWFVQTGDQKRADYLFHEVNIEVAREEGKGWRAVAYHPCEDDHYNVKYEINFAGVDIKDWKLGYKVAGPHKSYDLTGVFTR